MLELGGGQGHCAIWNHDLGEWVAFGHLQCPACITGAMGTGWEWGLKPGGPRKPAWLAGRRGAAENVRALEGIGFLPPPAARSRLCSFPEGPNYHCL